MKTLINLTAAVSLIVVALTLHLFAENAAPAQGNLLRNPSFETVASELPDQADGWSRWGQWINREDAWTPTHDGKALIGYHHWQIESADDSGIWQDVTVTAGQKYQFSIYVNRDKAKDGNEAESVELRLEAVLVDHQETINSETAKVSDIETGDKWSKLTVTGTATNTVMRALIRVVPAKSAPRQGAVKFDDAALTAIDK